MYDLSQVKVSNSPHIRSEDNTRQIMLDVIIALVPALALAIFVFGARALVVTAVYAFLAIRHDGVSMLDFLRYAGAFFFGHQYYEWRLGS